MIIVLGVCLSKRNKKEKAKKDAGEMKTELLSKEQTARYSEMNAVPEAHEEDDEPFEVLNEDKKRQVVPMQVPHK